VFFVGDVFKKVQTYTDISTKDPITREVYGNVLEKPKRTELRGQRAASREQRAESREKRAKSRTY
jgi:hypothetical protein